MWENRDTWPMSRGRETCLEKRVHHKVLGIRPRGARISFWQESWVSCNKGDIVRPCWWGESRSHEREKSSGAYIRVITPFRTIVSQGRSQQ
jgi:hypothetical protein